MAYEYSGIYRPDTTPPDWLIASKADISSEQMNILKAYIFAADSARKSGDDISSPDSRRWFIEKCAQLEQWRVEEAQPGGLLQHKRRYRAITKNNRAYRSGFVMQQL